MRASLAAAVAVPLLIAASAAPAHASLVLALDLPTMVTRADHIAVVDVVSVKADWDANHEQILSTIDLAVVESWKGGAAPASHFIVVQPGGTVGDLTQTVHGMTRFVPGERAVVFLSGQAGHASVVGMAQGKRLVRRDVATGRFVVHAPDRAGATFIRSTGATTPSPVFQLQARPLDELKTDVRTLMAKPAPASGAKPGNPTGGTR
ncbi:MAG TPA: hypothetical protein VN903_23255 [Polyangia bacterium]|jgi:hypothetical protein|nr:hypothetical protein [Polyangia bacterium]